MVDVTKILDVYINILNKEQELILKQKEELEKLLTDKEKIENFLIKNVSDLEDISEVIIKNSPYTAWEITVKTDKSVIDAHMMIDDVLIPKLEKANDDRIEKLKDQRSKLEKWALAELLKRKSTHFSVKGSGRSELKIDVKYSIKSKKDLVEWALKENAINNLTIQIRPNSKFMKEVIEKDGTLPPAVTSFKENKVKFVKA